MLNKSQVQLTHIHKLICNAGNPAIDNIHQLCRQLFGRKRCASIAFQRLMHWLNYAKRKDGAVYKSAHQLAFEVGCAEKTIDRAIPLLIEAGFDVVVKKAEGAPTRHFYLNVERFIKRLAEIFGFNEMEIRVMMELNSSDDFKASSQPTANDQRMWVSSQNLADSDISVDLSLGLSPDEIARNVQKDLGKMSESLTRTNDSFYNTIKKHGFSSFLERQEAMSWCRELDTKPEVIETWVRSYGFNMVKATVSEAKNRKRDGKIQKSVFGWVRRALEAKHRNNNTTW